MNLKVLKIDPDMEASLIALIKRQYGYIQNRYTLSTRYKRYGINRWFALGSHSWIEYEGSVYTYPELINSFKNRINILNHRPLNMEETECVCNYAELFRGSSGNSNLSSYVNGVIDEIHIDMHLKSSYYTSAYVLHYRKKIWKKK